MKQEHINEIFGIVFLSLSLLIFVSLVSYNPNDVGFFTSTPNPYIKNFAGIIGAYIASVFFFLTGLTSYGVPILTLIWALNKFIGKQPTRLYIKTTGTVVLFLAGSSFLSMFTSGDSVARTKAGGIVGFYLSEILVKYCGMVGGYIIVLMLLLLSFILATEFLVIPFVVGFANAARKYLLRFKPPVVLRKTQATTQQPLPKKAPQEAKQPTISIKKEDALQVEQKKPQITTAPIFKSTVHIKPKSKPQPLTIKPLPPKEVGDYKLPSPDLLDSPPPIEERKIKEDLANSAKILEETLRDFGIEVKVTNIEQGPIITRYEVEPAPGVKVHKITALNDDIALVMKATSVRLVAPIPGKSAIGVEIPNRVSEYVYLKEVLQTPEFTNAASKLTLAIGKDVAGDSVVCDLGDMPHLLIAGTTGSGKTVCVNSIITSMIFNATPDEVRFIMVDPKMVELAMFNNLPHLLCPVVTEPKKVSGALNWLVNEMEARYKLFAKLGVRNIELYNQKLSKKELPQAEIPETLPYIVVIIDELADLMAVASGDIENAITRLAQLSRAVGIHIILATQRPSVDVVTGVIKANFPSRISFQVASKVDSRTVLDMNGAEKLLGKGDMLFLKPGTAKPIRAQGCLVSDKEVEKVVNFIKSQREPLYDEEILKEQQKRVSQRSYEKDELFDEAVRMVLETKQASVSMLQRRLRLGYTRAARLIDSMEEEGIVGPYRGSKPREILIDKLQEESHSDETSASV